MKILHVVTRLILKGCVKETILLTLSHSKNKPFYLAVLFTCVLIVLSSAAVFAASEDPGSPDSSEVSFLAPDLDSVEAYDLAKEVHSELMSDPIKAAAANYTIDDIYTFLYDAMRGQSSISGYSLPRISFYLYRIAAILAGTGDSVPTAANSISARLATISSNISNIKTYTQRFYDDYIANTAAGYGSLMDQIQLASVENIETLPLIYSSLQQVHADGQNNTYYLSQINSKMSGSYSWTSTNISPSWYLNKDRQVISTSQTGTSFSAVFQNFYSTSSDIPLLYRVYVPIMASDLYHVVSDFDLSVGYFNPSDNSLTSVDSSVDYYLEPTTRGTYIYLFGFRPQNVSYVTFTLSGNVQFDSSYTGSVSVMSFDSDSYQQIKQAFNSHSTNHYLEYLANSLVDPAMQQAKEESQPVIDDTLDGFTGSGSAAPSTGDTGSMKGISGSVRSGLDTGASAGDAVSVFSNSTFWGWFSQDNSDKINSTYPAPDVNSMFNTRAPGDYVPDFISGDQDYLSDHLGSNPW